MEFKQELLLSHSEPLMEIIGGSNIQIIDTFLLAQHRYDNPTHFWEVYGVNSLKHLKSVLSHGRGPLEVLFSYYAGQYEKVNGDNWMFTLDMNASKLFKINLDESIRSGVDIVELISPLPRHTYPYFVTGDGLFLNLSYDQEKGTVCLIIEDNSWENPTVVKEIYSNISPEDYYIISPKIYYNRKRNKVCIIPKNLDYIRITDFKGNGDIIVSTADSDGMSSARQERDRDWMQMVMPYSNSMTTDDYIFALYINKKIANLNDIPEESVIHVFDWNGEAVAKLRFEDYVTSFAVDMKNKTIYTMDNMEQLYKYDINSIF